MHLAAHSTLRSLLWAASTALPLAAQGAPDRDLIGLGLEELMEIEVHSATREARPLAGVPGAVFVVTAEDMRRAGITTVAEALRLVPGVHVARIDASRWAIGIRGFTGEFNSKLLVMVDGRSVYTPLFLGVYWEIQDLPIESIERIEVVRGPGGARWGANAMSGVIHIITRHAADARGGTVQTAVGSDEHGIATLRYGLAVGDDTDLMLYARSRRNDEQVRADGSNAGDGWSLNQAGFRLDGGDRSADRWTIDGRVAGGHLDRTYTVPARTAPFSDTLSPGSELFAAHLLARYTWVDEAGGEAWLQGYWDHTDRQTGSFLRERRHTLDVEGQYATDLGGNRLVFGGGARWTADDIDGSPLVSFEPRGKALRFNLFVQYEIALVADTLALHAGTKVEHDEFSGFEVQPDLRLTWRPRERLTLWMMAARAVSTPSRFTADGRLDLSSQAGPGGLAAMGVVFPAEHVDPEELHAFEAGLRWQPADRLLVEAAAFAHLFDDLRSVRPGTPFVEPGDPPRIVTPLVQADDAKAEAYGFELHGIWQARDDLRVGAGWSYLDLDGRNTRFPAAPDLINDDRTAPEHIVDLNVRWDPGPQWQVDAVARYTGAIDGGAVGEYVRLDLRVGWQPDDRTAIDLVLRNLLEDRHAEFVQSLYAVPSEVPRSVLLQVVHRF